MTEKQKLQERIDSLKGNKDKQGELIEATALFLVHRDMLACASIGHDVVGQWPTVEETLSIHQLYQAYLGPSYQYLLAKGDIQHPPVETNNSGHVRTKDQLDS